MADYQKIIELRPEVAEFIRFRRSICYRGDVLAYGANISCDSFSTDASGFRHSMLGGKSFSVADCLQSERFGVVLGASNTFGFGVAGNEKCMASLLAERFGFPFANCAMPGANSRNLHSLLLSLLARSTRRPVVVVHSSGGDLANFCESSVADPVFGSPNRGQLRRATNSETGVQPDPERSYPRLLAFTSLWTSAIAALCRAHKVGLILGHQTTFFEKTKPSGIELECGLGEPSNPRQERQFANHRKYNEGFYRQRKLLADRMDVSLPGWGLTDQLGFVDEFHCDVDGIRALSDASGEIIDQLLAA
jgi:hypothetical protein